MSHPSHHFAPGDQRCLYCGGIRETSETDELCAGRVYDDIVPDDEDLSELVVWE